MRPFTKLKLAKKQTKAQYQIKLVVLCEELEAESTAGEIESVKDLITEILTVVRSRLVE